MKYLNLSYVSSCISHADILISLPYSFHIVPYYNYSFLVAPVPSNINEYILLNLCWWFCRFYIRAANSAWVPPEGCVVCPIVLVCVVWSGEESAVAVQDRPEGVRGWWRARENLGETPGLQSGYVQGEHGTHIKDTSKMHVCSCTNGKLPHVLTDMVVYWLLCVVCTHS